ICWECGARYSDEVARQRGAELAAQAEIETQRAWIQSVLGKFDPSSKRHAVEVVRIDASPSDVIGQAKWVLEAGLSLAGATLRFRVNPSSANGVLLAQS